MVTAGTARKPSFLAGSANPQPAMTQLVAPTTIARTKSNCSMLACSLRICAGGCLRVSQPRGFIKQLINMGTFKRHISARVSGKGDNFPRGILQLAHRRSNLALETGPLATTMRPARSVFRCFQISSSGWQSIDETSERAPPSTRKEVSRWTNSKQEYKSHVAFIPKWVRSGHIGYGLFRRHR